MARAHVTIPQAVEIMFCDCTSSLDRFNTSLLNSFNMLPSRNTHNIWWKRGNDTKCATSSNEEIGNDWEVKLEEVFRDLKNKLKENDPQINTGAQKSIDRYDTMKSNAELVSTQSICINVCWCCNKQTGRKTSTWVTNSNPGHSSR